MSGPTTLATAVVVTYQSERTLPAMLAAARRCRDEGVLECVFVDNGSVDGTQEILRAQDTWSEVVLTGKNNGFGRGCNIGLERVHTPYTVFINPDAVVEPEAIRAMVAFLEEHPTIGIVGPALVEGENEHDAVLQDTGPRPTPLSILQGVLPHRRSVMRPIVPGSQPFRTGWVCGAVLMIRTSLAKQLGGFDPRFFLYWEETDLCRRADDLGLQTWALGSAVARHIGGASSVDDGTRVGGCIAKYYYQSRRHYMVKHHGWFAATAAELIEWAVLALRSSVDALRGRGWVRMRPRLQAPLLSAPRKV